ncbi:hypothetical protein SUBVAR_05708 [Subdoligranulum variabile DSM 15176]|uniref:Uncharacterized protein n=1 Tax=Subdoligranulum variabile DSM 15176 TaxID=411471 RepID=D1PMZ3_9FIRM|nr:hypothetical protein SUBVAR_05708 [Subdoligranulum variabile DSM 15176]
MPVPCGTGTFFVDSAKNFAEGQLKSGVYSPNDGICATVFGEF